MLPAEGRHLKCQCKRSHKTSFILACFPKTLYYLLSPIYIIAVFPLKSSSFHGVKQHGWPSSVTSSLPRGLKSHLSAAGHELHFLQRRLPLETPDGPHISENGNTFKKPHGVRKCSTRGTKLFHSSLFWQIFNSLVYPCLVFTHKTWNNSIYQVYLDGAVSWHLK